MIAPVRPTVLEFGSTFYLPFLLFPMKRTGVPKWPGKREELIQYMQAGFKSGVADYGKGGAGETASED